MRTLTKASLQRLFLFLLLLAICVSTVIADTAGPNSPANAANTAGTGTVAWANPGRARVSDNSRATATLNDNIVSNYLVVRNFTFSVPANSTINGIVVDFERSVTATGSPVRDAAVRLVKNGVIQAADRSTATSWPGADAYETHGGTTDLWGTALTAADVNNASFGVAISATKAGTTGGNRNARVDYVRMTVYYTPPDTTPPVVTVPAGIIAEATGPSGATVDFVATAVDNIDGPLTPTCIPGSGATFPLIPTIVTCVATDSAGNTGSASFTINVLDTTPPVFTPTIDQFYEATSPAGASVTYSPPTADDIVSGSVGVVCTPVSGSTFAFGATTVGCTATDSFGNSAPNSFTVTVTDTTPPSITLLGTNSVTVEVGSVYSDAGATALDNVDGNITGSIIIFNPVNSNVLGSYAVTYGVMDSSGNPAVQVTRTVDVVDTTLPIITVQGPNPISVSYGSAYIDAGATALDNYDGDITGAIVAVNPVDTSSLGAYTVTYGVNDSSGNNAVQETRTVNVVDTAIPIITLLGTSPVTVALGGVYTDAGATAVDDVDGGITGLMVTVNPVDTSSLGAYTVTYDVADSSGNNASTVARTVNVVDLTPPVITLLGIDPVIVEAATPYADAGATALDNVDGDITGAIITVNPVNTNAVGAYTVTYDVSDAAGNAAVQVTRGVNVVDTTAPVISLLGSDPVIVEVGSAYSDAGATAVDTLDGGITGAIITVNPVNTSVLGSYTVTYDINDSSGNNAVQETRTVNVVDTTAPVITIIGAGIVNITAGNSYTDAGATALDNYDGNITGAIVSSSTVNAHDAGTYNVTYSVNDSSDNTASATRTVNVQTQPDYHDGLGKYAFSHFAQQAPAPSAAPASAAAAPAAAPAPAAIGPPAAAPSGGEAQGMAAEQGGAAMQAPAGVNPVSAGNEISGAAVEETTGNQITGAVTGFFNKTKWYWLAGLIAFVMMLLGYWDYRRRKRQGAENSDD